MPRQKPAQSIVVQVVQTFTFALWRHCRSAWDAGRPPGTQQQPQSQQQRPLTVSLREVHSPTPKMLCTTTTTTTRSWDPSAVPAAQLLRGRLVWLGALRHCQPPRQKAATCRWNRSQMDTTCHHRNPLSPTAVHVQNRHRASRLLRKSWCLSLRRWNLLLPPGWPEPPG